MCRWCHAQNPKHGCRAPRIVWGFIHAQTFWKRSLQDWPEAQWNSLRVWVGWFFFFPKKSILNIFHFSKYQLSFPPPFSKAFPLKWITALCLILKFQTESHTQGMASQNSNWKSTWPRQEEAIWMSGYVLEHIRQQPLQNCLSCLSSHAEPHCRDPFPSSLCGNISERVPAMNRDPAPHGGRQESPVPKASG